MAMESLNWPLLKLGVTTPDVKPAQHLLTCRGYPAEATGTFDEDSGDAARDFREHVGLPPAKEVDGDTWDYLTNFTLDQNNAPQKRDCVMAAQLELNKQKSKPQLDVDGKFGNLTKEAILYFQRRIGADETGTVNPPTWKNLVCRKPPAS